MQLRETWYFVYIMTNRSKTLYIGFTSILLTRVFQHKTGSGKGFTTSYKLDHLVYWENYKSVHRAIAREKQLKGWTRIKKIQLIVSVNPTWKDLAADWYKEKNA